ncbi:hypothetical protein AG1IA_10263 [Rhizoctonia solani AG-1 IA]|uniref:Uncharacterized protein n=1 Tax=Thanatephorus cucumeris (strain AG1-IA) TaxID=983506 RepID=L8WG64_THACA|nr:hypothetical protein AG1IA_10263 [Rhizoctonia solani AG-1 IA]
MCKAPGRGFLKPHIFPTVSVLLPDLTM